MLRKFRKNSWNTEKVKRWYSLSILDAGQDFANIDKNSNLAKISEVETVKNHEQKYSRIENENNDESRTKTKRIVVELPLFQYVN